MALQAASVVILFLGCLLFPNGAPQTLYESWTVAFAINASDPLEVKKAADTVQEAVRNLTDQINQLSLNLTNTNSSDYNQLQTLLTDVQDLSNTITAISAQYVNATKQRDDVTTTLIQINNTLHCFADAKCVTGGPTTSPFTGSTTFHPCSSSPCQNGGTCYPNGAGHTCACVQPYTGDNCENVGCFPDPGNVVSANETVQDFPSSQFPLLIHGFNCTWRIRASPGQHVLVNVQSVTFNGTGGLFQVIDWANNNAVFNATENTATGSYEINGTVAAVRFNTLSPSIAGAFKIQYSAVAFNACANYNSCGNGTCVAVGSTPECKCNTCWTGPTCSIYEGDPCASFGNLCGDNGDCTYNASTCRNPHCACKNGYTGDFCDMPPPTTAAFRYYKLDNMPDREE